MSVQRNWQRQCLILIKMTLWGIWDDGPTSPFGSLGKPKKIAKTTSEAPVPHSTRLWRTVIAGWVWTAAAIGSQKSGFTNKPDGNSILKDY